VSRFGATSKTALPIWPMWPNFDRKGLDWQCCLAGSSKTALRILIFSVVLGAENLSYMKSIETHARAFLTLNILSIGDVKVVKMAQVLISRKHNFLLLKDPETK
jgi:hypothetical protein